MSVNWLYKPSLETSIIDTVLEYESRWVEHFNVTQIRQQLSEIAVALHTVQDPALSAQQNLYATIDYLIDDLGFTGPGLQMLPESALANLSFCIMHRTGNELTLAVVFHHLLEQIGFKTILSDADDNIALVVQLTHSEYVIIDPLSGATEYLISQQDVKENLTNEISRYASHCNVDELIKVMLTDQKLAMLDEGLFAPALKCVECLMELLPEDPYERRDRGLVLNQLDCEAWAKDDLDYFVKACPNDPMATFIRLQLEEQQNIVATIH